MNQTTPTNNEFESTYALVVRSEEKGRGGLEMAVYLLLVLSVVFSIWQFAHQSVAFPIGKAAIKPSSAIEAQRS